LRGKDNADIIDDMPISLQLVARRLEEEKVVAVVKRVVAILARA
jgi:Asp-tRNA(Asn)/Glu-tRNA(Gln) amidotransferase A subunit family amidase